MTQLEVNNLKIQFKTDNGIFTAVEDINFNVQKGEVLGIVGESGSGKSVTSLSIMQLLPQAITSGEIFYNDENKITDLLKTPENKLYGLRGKEISMIFQEPMTSLNPVFTCGNQVSESIMLHEKLNAKEAKGRTISLFDDVLLPRPEKIYNAYPHELSGGQKQRVMIAMAIACNPKILIADEPTTALDVTVQKTILELILSLKDKLQLSVIFITHDLGVISEIADRVLVMYKGKIVEQGPVAQIFSHPRHPYTKGLLACRPPINTQLFRLPVMNDFIEVSSDGVIKSTDNTVESVLQKFEQDKKIKVDRFHYFIKEHSLLEVENLVIKFPLKKGFFQKSNQYVYAVNQVNLNVKKGEVVGLVGESGCGKTTLGRAVLNLIHPNEGIVKYKGENILKLSAKEMRQLRKKIQIIFQDPYSSLNPRMTIGNAIQEPMAIHKIFNSKRDRRKKTEELLERVGLSPIMYSRYPHEFSGGQRQRICIARALAVMPEFIICDESVSALDVSVQAQVLNLLNDLKDEFQLTYIFISHDLAVVRYMSDRIIVMKSGQIVEEGASNTIYFNPENEYTKRLISSIPGQQILK